MEKDNIKELTKLLELPNPGNQKTIMKLKDIKDLRFISMNFSFYNLFGNEINPYSLVDIPNILDCDVVDISHNRYSITEGIETYSGKVTEIKLKIINSFGKSYIITDGMEGKFGKDIEE